MDLDMIRSQINQLDEELVALLEKRMELVDQVAAYKRATGKPVLDTSQKKLFLKELEN